jgi:spermidine synthase
MYDVILMDLPDPSDASLGKLYSRPFYRLAGRRLAEGGIIATQATSPYRSREAFWCIYHTLAESECDPGTARLFKPLSYQTVVPTFGTWGFVLASREEIDPSTIRVTVPTKYLNDEVIASLFVIPPDMGEVDTPITELNDPAVSRLYRTGYHRYFD